MRSEYCLAGDYGFAKDKGDRWMTEDTAKVLRFQNSSCSCEEQDHQGLHGVLAYAK